MRDGKVEAVYRITVGEFHKKYLLREYWKTGNLFKGFPIPFYMLKICHNCRINGRIVPLFIYDEIRYNYSIN